MARRPRIKMADDIQNASENDVDESTCNSDSTETMEVHTPTGATSALPFVSIVLAVHDNACELEERLPQLLEQQYRGKWEVIIVDESSTDDTQDVLTRAKAKYPRLYTTFIPESSHYISRRKLSLTMAVKASKGDWILITDIDCKPTGNRWLATMAQPTTKTWSWATPVMMPTLLPIGAMTASTRCVTNCIASKTELPIVTSAAI